MKPFTPAERPVDGDNCGPCSDRDPDPASHVGCVFDLARENERLAAKCRAMEAVVSAARKETHYRGGHYASPALCIAVANYDALAADPEMEKP